ncbi:MULTISPECIES: carbohydrate kinase family protein [unclassified Clostridium]|uniref:carbohydrate kinase family protein n=1 Tax=unclassified Clostridium TaxID=2614128 RepID=UPI001105DF97|nr:MULTISPECIES: carbohydrate kinase family protein [unclassified Clostridium]
MDIIGVGGANMDLLVQMDEINLGFKTPMGDFSLQGGGLIASAMAAAARLGAKVGMAGAIGDSTFGKMAMEDLAMDGVDTSHMIVRKGARDAFGIILAEKKTMERTILGRQGTVEPAKFEELDHDYLVSGKFMFLSTADELTISCAKLAHEHGVKVGYDADGRADPEIFDLIPYLDVFIASEVWYHNHYGTEENFEKHVREIQAMGPEIVVVTLGVRGCVGVDKDGKFFQVPSFRVPVIDTTGAGDIFHGAFLVGLLQGWSAEQTARFSSAVSAIKCTRLGGRAALPKMETVLEFLETGEIEYGDIDERVELFRSRSF